MNPEQRAAGPSAGSGQAAPLSRRAYAKHRKALGLDGGSDAAVRKAIRDQRIVGGVTADGKIIAAIADAEWKRNTGPRPAGSDPARPPARPRTQASRGDGATPGSSRQAGPPAASPPPLSFGASNYQLDRARRENVKLRKEVIELRKLEEKFVNADEVKVAQFNKGRILRDGVFSIADRLAAPLAAETDQRKCWEMLLSEFRQVFTQFAEGTLVVSQQEPPERRETAAVEP